MSWVSVWKSLVAGQAAIFASTAYGRSALLRWRMVDLRCVDGVRTTALRVESVKATALRSLR